MYDLLLNFLDTTSIYFEIFLEKAEISLGAPYEEINFWLSPILLIILLIPFIFLIFFIGKIFKSIKDEIYIYSFIIVFIGLISFFTYFNSIFLVTGTTGDSMLPNFQKEYEILGKNYFLKNDIKYGDVVIIESHKNTGKKNLVKRVLGLPGDKINIKNGIVILNKRKLKQTKDGEFIYNGKKYKKNIEYISNVISYKILDDGNHYYQDYLSEITIPKNHYFVLGDNRDNSQDSRFLKSVGFIPKENLVGKAWFIFFSLNDSRFYEIWKWPYAIRGSRIFKLIK